MLLLSVTRRGEPALGTVEHVLAPAGAPQCGPQASVSGRPGSWPLQPSEPDAALYQSLQVDCVLGQELGEEPVPIPPAGVTAELLGAVGVRVPEHFFSVTPPCPFLFLQPHQQREPLV